MSSTEIDQFVASCSYRYFCLQSLYFSFPKKLRVALYGTGSAGKNLYTFFKHNRPDIEVVFFVDSFKTGNMFGLKIVNPNKLRKLENEYDIIIVSSFFIPEIRGVLDYFKIKRYCVYYFNFKYSVEYYERNIDKFANVRSLLHEDQDKDLFDLLVRFSVPTESVYREVGEFCETIRKTLFESSFFSEFHRADAIQYAIEGGVYDCATTMDVLNNCNNIKKLYSFDPDVEMFEQHSLCAKLKSDKRVDFIHKALWMNSGRLSFYPADDGSSKVNSNSFFSGNLVECVSIDDFVKNNKNPVVDFIRLDTEGAEKEILIGAKKTIRKCSPQMEISVYHRNGDLLDIPLFLDGLCSRYKHRLRHNSMTLSETIWHCVPNDLC